METNNDSCISYSEVSPLLLLIFISSSVTFPWIGKTKTNKIIWNVYCQLFGRGIYLLLAH